MRVLKGTYRVSLWDFITLYSKNIKNLEYTREEAHDCIEMINNGILQFLKIYVINGDLKSCCKLITIARDFMNNKMTDRSGKFFKEYSYIDKFGTNKSGGSLAKYILKRAIQDKNFKVLFRFIPDMSARFIGMKVGKR